MQAILSGVPATWLDNADHFITFGIFVEDGDGELTNCVAVLFDDAIGFLFELDAGNMNDSGNNVQQTVFSFNYLAASGVRLTPGTTYADGFTCRASADVFGEIDTGAVGTIFRGAANSGGLLHLHHLRQF